MRSALYYPDTAIQSKGLLKTALLLWDVVQVIVPWPDYRPLDVDDEYRRAFEVVGDYCYPSVEAKKLAHQMIEDLATRPALPAAFSYSSATVSKDVYEMYPQKLLDETWRLLHDAKLAGAALSNADMPVANPMGLTLMSILADCCAGQTRTRITDQSAAYAGLAALLAPPDETTEATISSQQARDELVSITLDIVDVGKLPMEKLIAFREREKSEAKGHAYRDLRHRYVERLETEVRDLVKAKTPEDRENIRREFRQSMKDDFGALKEGLRSKAIQTLSTKEFLVAAIAGAGTLAANVGFGPVQLPDVVSAIGGPVTVGGLIALKSKFAESRREVLKKHSMSYLYEWRGGLRV